MSKVNKPLTISENNDMGMVKIASIAAPIKQTFKTRLSKDGEQFVTNATFDFTDVTVEQLQQLALKTLVINAQAVYRASGNVPQHDIIKVADMLARERSGGGRVMSVEKLAGNISKMSAEDKARMLALLSA